MSEPVGGVDTLFCHGADDHFLVAPRRDGTRLVLAKLELGETAAGPRPQRFRVVDSSHEDPRDPDEFIELARQAARIRISEQTAIDDREQLMACLSGYQLAEKASTVRTCRWCATAGRYSPLTNETAIATDDEHVCQDCAREQLHRELAYRGDLSGAAKKRLEELLYATGDLDRIVNLLSGELDPELTKFDELDATVDAVDSVSPSELSLHPGVKDLLVDRYDELLPVQSLAVRNGLLDGADQLVVSATATGKTLVGEMAGLHRTLSGNGKVVFLVPLVALANQKYRDFEREYGHLVDVTLRVGGSRITGSGATFDPTADVIVGTYEGIDHALRTGTDLGDIGTVVIDEVHNLGEPGRGHRLDGLIVRLKEYCENRAANRSGYTGAQWVYLSATVGNVGELATGLDAVPIEFEERPVPVERHVLFADADEKIRVTNRLVKRAFDAHSSKGYRGQTIVFTNSRRRCHEISRRLDYESAPYHAGLDYDRRKTVEGRFADQELAAVVTTAALAAGVDFPASQVVFDALAMGIEWLSVGEFQQMLGRAGRPDYHDRGQVYVLVEPDHQYHHSMDRTEDEVAFHLLKGEMEDVAVPYDEAAAVEETLANVVVAGDRAKALNERLLGEVPTTHAIGKLLEYEFIAGLEPTELGMAVSRHFLSPDEAFLILDGVRAGRDPDAIVADLVFQDEE